LKKLFLWTHAFEHFCLQISIFGLYLQLVLKSFMGCQCDTSDQNHLEKFSSAVTFKIHFCGMMMKRWISVLKLQFLCLFIK
jgi:hypothetical protein